MKDKESIRNGDFPCHLDELQSQRTGSVRDQLSIRQYLIFGEEGGKWRRLDSPDQCLNCIALPQGSGGQWGHERQVGERRCHEQERLLAAV